ncbi:MAG TPA: dienelactone hydrolase family protein, partial [Spongiibacteraceae bacterium]|nr:dienelactone hydrolase family protein [Spongiibacteraceae bacterium]
WDDSHSGKRPGIVVFPEAFGLGEHARQCAEQLAQLGYIALAADPHGEGKIFTDMAGVGPAIQALYADRSEWRSRAQAALDTLVAQPLVDADKIAAIGFCFGGTTCLELARSGAPLSAIVTFHAGLLPEAPEDAGRMRAKVLLCHGADDPIVKQETIDTVMNEFRRDKVDWQFNYYGNTVHSFTNPFQPGNVPGFAYNATVTARAWATMRNLFDEIFN